MNIDKQNVALTAARLWAEKQMDVIPHGVQMAILSRDEYEQLLVLVYSQGVVRGMEIVSGK